MSEEERGLRVRFERFGPPADVLETLARSPEPPRDCEILVRMLQAPINPSDLIPVRGAYAHRIPLPCIPGYEGVGVVADVGPGVSSSLLGRRVLPLRGEGTWQSHVRSPAELAVPVPAGVSDDEACQLYINPLTAKLLLSEALPLRPGDALAVNAGGSALGRALAQLAFRRGLRLVAATRCDRHAKELLALGAWRVVNAAAVPLREAMRELTGGAGLAAAIDMVGGAEGTALALCVRPGGAAIGVGLLSGRPVDAAAARAAGVEYRPYWLRHWIAGATTGQWHEAFGELLELVRQGGLTLPQAGERFALSRVREATVAAERGGRVGKVILRP